MTARVNLAQLDAAECSAGDAEALRFTVERFTPAHPILSDRLSGFNPGCHGYGDSAGAMASGAPNMADTVFGYVWAAVDEPEPLTSTMTVRTAYPLAVTCHWRLSVVPVPALLSLPQ